MNKDHWRRFPFGNCPKYTCWSSPRHKKDVNFLLTLPPPEREFLYGVAAGLYFFRLLSMYEKEQGVFSSLSIVNKSPSLH
jgi:hypothetical protein